MKWKLHDKKWNIVAEIELPDDASDVVIFEGRIFHYDERVERYVSLHGGGDPGRSNTKPIKGTPHYRSGDQPV
jgi:hypothetical protein